MKTRMQILVVAVGLLTMAAVASASGPGTCGNIPPRDGTGRQVGRPAVVQIGPLGWMQLAWRYGLPSPLGTFGWGPGDGTGFGGDGPEDGTGYGPGTGICPGTGTGICDGTGPHATRTGPKR